VIEETVEETDSAEAAVEPADETTEPDSAA